jgi:hypothetical protein
MNEIPTYSSAACTVMGQRLQPARDASPVLRLE